MASGTVTKDGGKLRGGLDATRMATAMLSPSAPIAPIRCGIYRITCKPTGDTYIGQAANMSLRWSQHFTKIHKGNHDSATMRALSEKHPHSAFEFAALVECDVSDLSFFETLLIEGFKPSINRAPPMAWMTVNRSGPKPVRKFCEVCGMPAMAKGDRYCTKCRRKKVGEMKRAGYLKDGRNGK